MASTPTCSSSPISSPLPSRARATTLAGAPASSASSTIAVVSMNGEPARGPSMQKRSSTSSVSPGSSWRRGRVSVIDAVAGLHAASETASKDASEREDPSFTTR